MLDGDKGNRAQISFQLPLTHVLRNFLKTCVCDSEEEEEEEEESDEESQELSLPSDAVVLGDESLEPPAKLARTDQRVLFTTGPADN